MNLLIEGTKIIAWGYVEYKPTSFQTVKKISPSGRPSVNKKDCYWDGSQIKLKTGSEILNEYKIKIINKVKVLAKNKYLDLLIDGLSIEDIRTKFDNFKTRVNSSTDKDGVDAEYIGALGAIWVI